MCIVAIAWQCFTNITDDLPLLLLSNRDEFFERPTLPLHHWQHAPILAGKDSQSSGTWLGINPKNGKWATVLNVRQLGQAQPEPALKTSRGKLVSDYLTSTLPPRAFAQQIPLAQFEGFNFVLGDTRQAFIISNRGQALESLPAGLHVFSNGEMTGAASHWEKCEKLRGKVRQEVLPLVQTHIAVHLPHAISSTYTSEKLADWQKAAFDCLKNNQKASTDRLPHTGFAAEFELALSSIFIEKLAFKQGYGTRTSSVLALGHKGYDFTSYDTQTNLWQRFHETLK